MPGVTAKKAPDPASCHRVRNRVVFVLPMQDNRDIYAEPENEKKDGQELPSVELSPAQVRARTLWTTVAFTVVMLTLLGGSTWFIYQQEKKSELEKEEMTEEELMEIGRQTLRDEIRFNQGAEFSTLHGPDPEFVRNEPLAPTGSVFDVDAAEVATIWERL